jgi:hypothetical protein
MRALRLWGRVGFLFFLSFALILAAMLIVEGRFSLPGALGVGAFVALGLAAPGLARLYEWIAGKRFSGHG